MKTNLLFRTLLLLVFIALINNVKAQEACYTNWQHKTKIMLDNTLGDTLENYELKIILDTETLINNGEMKADGSDIRFTSNENCCTELCYYIDKAINTDSTEIYVKIPYMLDGLDSINLIYGNSMAVDMSDAECVFTLYDGFTDSLTSTFSDVCGDANPIYSNGNVALSWTSSGMISSNDTLSSDYRYTVESKVNAAAGNWPGIYLSKVNDMNSYAILLGNSKVRISYKDAVGNHCGGHNWASTEFNNSSIIGVWSLTWANTGEQYAYFPSIGNISANENSITLNEDLVVNIGGISSGSGSMELDWIRVKKYVANEPVVTFGSAQNNEVLTVDLGADMTTCGEVTLDVGSLFDSYTWSTGDMTATSTVNSSQEVSLQVADNMGCIAKDTILITIANLNLNIGLANDTFTAEAIGVSYKWLDCNNGNIFITGETNQSFSPSQSGEYAVQITQGACVDTSNCYSYAKPAVGINELSFENFKVFPNPTSDVINLDFIEALSSIMLLNLRGQKVKVFNPNSKQLNISNLDDGIYFLEITNPEKKSVIKIVKN